MKILMGLLCLLTLSMSAIGQELYSDMIPYPFHEKQAGSVNQVMSITDGRAALQLRLEMIRRAKKTVEVEYFIYNTDLAGKILTKELIRAAQRGVKIRILVDKAIVVHKLDEYYAKALSELGIEVRYYNRAPFVRVSTVQFRNHRKLITVDDTEALTGGRNIGDDYFDFSEKFNFADTDIYVSGPIVATIRKSFDKFFEHKISERPSLSNLSNPKKEEEVRKFLADSEEETLMLENLATIGKKNLEQVQSFTCPETTYVTDTPGATFFSRLDPKFDEKYKFVRKVLFDKLTRVDKSIVISTPYLIANGHTKKLLKTLQKNNVDITVYTNSLASNDTLYVAANFYLEVFKWAKKGLHIYVHDGIYVEQNAGLEDKYKNAVWGTHTKAQVYENSDSTEAMIGTYNIDNRSNFYNAEMALFCKGNDEFTKVVKSEIMTMARNGNKINKDGSAYDRYGKPKSIFGSTEKDLLMMRIISLPSWLLKFLL